MTLEKSKTFKKISLTEVKVKKKKLTVGEGETWSDIVFCGSCMEVSNKKETEPSHDHGPHASTCQLALFTFQVFVEIHEVGFFFLFVLG